MYVLVSGSLRRILRFLRMKILTARFCGWSFQLVPLFLTSLRSQDPIDPLNSLTTLHALTCSLCKEIYIGQSGRRVADRFCEHLRDVEKKTQMRTNHKLVVRHFNLPNHSHNNMTICRLCLHHGNTKSPKNLGQKFIFQLGTLYPHGIRERLSFH